MRLSILSLICLSFLFFSCNKEDKNTVKEKEFKTNVNGNYMLHSSYPTESVRWDKTMMQYYNDANVEINSSYVINFDTKNFLNKIDVDSAFVVLYPYENESKNENQQAIYLINEPFREDFNWQNQPKVDSTIYAIADKIPSESSKAVKIDVTNLVKNQSKNQRFGFSLVFAPAIKNKLQKFVVVHSANSKSKNKIPTLKVYYH